MELFVNSQFPLMVETAGLLCAYVSGAEAGILTKDQSGCIPAEEVAAMMEQVCGHLDREDRKLQFYFRGYNQVRESASRTNLHCVASILINSGCADTFREPQACREAMHSSRLGMGEPFEINSYSEGLGITIMDDYHALVDELRKLDMPDDLRLALGVAISDYHHHVDEICDILEPLALRLAPLLAPWEERLKSLARQWQEMLDTEEKQIRFAFRISANMCKCNSLTITFRAFYPEFSSGTILVQEGKLYYDAGLAVPPGRPTADTLDTTELEAMQLLSNLDRLRILRLLVGRKLLPKEIVRELGLNRGNVFRDLNNLLQARLVEMVSHEGNLCYTANTERMNRVMERIRKFVSAGGAT